MIKIKSNYRSETYTELHMHRIVKNTIGIRIKNSPVTYTGNTFIIQR